MSWFKINDIIFYPKSFETQTSIINNIGSNLIYIKLDIKSHSMYKSIFMKKFEENKKFNIITSKIFFIGCYIKTIDFFEDELSIYIGCDYLEYIDICERRDEIINDLLEIK